MLGSGESGPGPLSALLCRPGEHLLYATLPSLHLLVTGDVIPSPTGLSSLPAQMGLDGGGLTPTGKSLWGFSHVLLL